MSTDASNESFVVAVRVRPPNSRELANDSHRDIVKICSSNVLCFDPRPDADDAWAHSAKKRPRQIAQRREKDLRLAFDCVLPPNSTQDDVYQNTAKRLVSSVMEGYNASCFAYGATGAGKTCTMIGNEIVGPGVMVLTMRDIFDQIARRSADTTFDVQCSYFEVYNETLRDLLLAEGRGKPLDLREDGQRGMVIAGLSTHAPKGADEVFELLARGNRNRSQCATDANSESSRSHGVFQIIVTHRDKAAVGGEGGGGGGVRVSKLSMIDLAGSERASVSKNQGAVMREGANINRSLLALGNCINALASGEAVGFVPYRDSKLTRLLKDSLGGNTRTVMIAAVSPSSLSHEDTHNTLQYANRAKNIKVRATKNEHSVEFHVSQYAQLLAEQRAQILDLQTRLSTALGSRATQHRALSEEQQQHLVAAERAVNERVLAFGEMQDAISAQYEDELRVRKRLRRAQLVASLQDAKLPLAPLVFGSANDAGAGAAADSALVAVSAGPSVRSVENEAHDARTVLAQRQHGLVAWQAELRAWMRGAESALPGARQHQHQAHAHAEDAASSGDPTQLGADARALLEAKADALVAKTTASALEARLTVRQHEIAYLHDQVVAARTDAAQMWALNKQIMAELAAQGVQLSAPLADRVAQRVDRPLGFVDSPGKAYPFLRDDGGGLGTLGSPAAVARAARRSRAKHAGNFTPTSPSFGNGNGNFSPAAIALRAPIAAAVAAHGTAGSSSSSSSSSSAASGRLFASPPPQAREYFTDMKSSDFFSAESMAYGGKAAPATSNNGSRTARALQPSTDAANANGGGGPLSELPLNAHASARAALVSAPKRTGTARPMSAHSSSSSSSSSASSSSAAAASLRAAWTSQNAPAPTASSTASASTAQPHQLPSSRPAATRVRAAIPSSSSSSASASASSATALPTRPASARPLTSGGSSSSSQSTHASSHQSSHPASGDASARGHATQHQRQQSAMHHRQQAQFLELQQQAAALQLWKDENAGDQYNNMISSSNSGNGNGNGNAALVSKASAVPPLNMRKVAASATVSSSSRGAGAGASGAAGHQLAFDAGAALVSARGAGVSKGGSSARAPVSLR